MCVRNIVHNWHTQHTQSSSDCFPSYPPGKHHQSSDAVYWRGGATESR